MVLSGIQRKRRSFVEKILVRNLLLYMLDAYDGDEDKLHEDYAKTLGVEKHQINLPISVIKSVF